jgi:site-specific DNA-methyltransferase (adenine-specific)
LLELNKIYNQDCLEGLKLLDDNSVNVVITSPPYAEQRKNVYGSISEDKYLEWFKPIALEIYRVMTDEGSFLLNIKEHSNKDGRSLYVIKLVLMLCEEVGFKLIDTFCWTKNSFPGKVKNKFKNAWEPVYHFAKQTEISIYPDNVAMPIKEESIKRAYRKFTGKTKNGSGFQCTASKSMRNATKAYPSNHLHFNNIVNQYSDNRWHPAVFPIDLPNFCIKAFTKIGDLILDPFMGSGTTAIACLNTNRQYIGFELSKKYCDLATKRIENHTQQLSIGVD